MALAIENLTVAPGGKLRLSVDRLSAETGALTFVIGPNGAGKTTLLKAIAGLLASTGRITWQGSNLADLSPRQRARTLAYVPQSQIAHWPITSRMAVAIGRNPHASSLTRLSEADSAAIDRALEATAATAYQDRPLDQLSGGERARILLARALAVEAPLLLLDEPVAALDPAHQIDFIAKLKGLSQARGLTILCVVHDLALASRYGDAIAIIDGGRLVMVGAPQTVLTDACLRNVFGVAAKRIRAEDRDVIVPWSVQSAADDCGDGSD